MNYLDVYFSRVNHFGETVAERIKNSGIVAFEKWMAQSPFTVTDLSVERGLYFSGIIQTRKDEEETKIMYLYVANDIPIVVGDILTWRQDNGAIEKWLLLQKEHKVHEQYQTFQIIKCNYELKWIDSKGYLKKSWAYAVSSVDSKVKSNFRMWHSLISPQPNKFAEIIMPRPIFERGSEDMNTLMRGITFIIDDEGWTVIECDWTSVEGIVYMSLTESKVNYHYDDRDVEIADLDRYKFPALPTLYKVGETIVPQFEEGTLNQWEIELQSSNTSIINGISDDPKQKWFSELHANAVGTCFVTMRLRNKPAVFKEIEITISEINEDIFYIKGTDEVRLDRQDIYKILSERSTETNEIPITLDTNEYIEFIVENIDKDEKVPLATLLPAYDENKKVIPWAKVLHANTRNKIGEVLLTAEYRRKTEPEGYEVLATYTKTIKIIPLW